MCFLIVLQHVSFTTDCTVYRTNERRLQQALMTASLCSLFCKTSFLVNVSDGELVCTEMQNKILNKGVIDGREYTKREI